MQKNLYRLSLIIIVALLVPIVPFAIIGELPGEQWLSARDEDVRESHVSEDGHVVKIGEPFPTTGLQFPSDPGGPPEEVINCRCVVLPVVKK